MSVDVAPPTSRSGEPAPSSAPPPTGSRPFIFALHDRLAALPVHGMPPAERAVLGAIASHAGRDGAGAFPSLKRISKLTGLGTSTIVRAIEVLADRGWLLRVARRDEQTGAATSNLYTVRLDGEPWGEEQKAKRARRPPMPNGGQGTEGASRCRQAEAPSPPGGIAPCSTAVAPSPPLGSPLSAVRQQTSHDPSVIPERDPTKNPPVAQARDHTREIVKVQGQGHPTGQAVLFGPSRPDPAPPPPPPPAEKPRDVDAVFSAYLEGREKAGLRGSPPVLDDKRRKLIRARLKDFSLDDLRDAARGIWAHPWNREQRQTGLELALRDAGHVERFRDVARAEAPQAGPRLKPGTIGPNGVEVKSDEEMDRVAPFRRPQPPRMPPPATPEQLERTYRRIVDEQNVKRRLEGRPLVALRNGTIVELTEGAA